MSRLRFGTRRLVFVDRSAVEVLDAFEALLPEYERGDTVLVTHEGMALDGLAGVCEVERLRPWLVDAAERTIDANPDLDLDIDIAAALVVMARQGIGEVLAADPRYAAVDVTVLPA